MLRNRREAELPVIKELEEETGGLAALIKELNSTLENLEQATEDAHAETAELEAAKASEEKVLDFVLTCSFVNDWEYTTN